MKERCTFAIRNVKEAFVCAFVMEGSKRECRWNGIYIYTYLLILIF